MAEQLIIVSRDNLTKKEAERLGAYVDDYNDSQLSLIVDISTIDADYDLNGGIYPVEAWGSVTYEEEFDITVRSCDWNGIPVLNADDVCWEIEKWLS